MPESRPRYANFPDSATKVVIGPHINASTTKQLSRLSIGTYEMSVSQQEKAQQTCESARVSLLALAKAAGVQIEHEKSREFVGVLGVTGSDAAWKIWITTPFEPGQSAHIVWARYQEVGGEKKIGIAYKLTTAFTADDIGNILRAAQKNAVIVADGEPYVLKGNPPPRFQKKAAKEEPVAPAAEAPQA